MLEDLELAANRFRYIGVGSSGGFVVDCTTVLVVVLGHNMELVETSSSFVEEHNLNI